jgi:acetyl esterase/lipase
MNPFAGSASEWVTVTAIPHHHRVPFSSASSLIALVRRCCLAAAVILLFVTAWIVLPAFNYPLLILAVGAPELSPWLTGIGLVIALLAFTLGPATSNLTRTTALIVLSATAIAAVPLVQFPIVRGRFDDAMRAAIGPTDFARPMQSGDARITRGLIIGTPGDVTLTVDIYRPPLSGRYPCVVQIYGGSWQRGAPDDDPDLARYLAARGFVVFAIDYRHAPRWQWPAQIEDVRMGLRWVREHAGEWDGDAARLAVFGRSAGAHLAMLAAYAPTAPSAPSAPSIDAVVSCYGPVALAEGYREPPVPNPLDTQAIERAFLGGTPDEFPDRYRDASPITYAGSGSPPSRPKPPTLLIYGARDHIVLPRFGRQLHERLRDSGSISIYLEIPWAEHAFDLIPNGLSGRLARDYIDRFLTWALQQQQPRP